MDALFQDVRYAVRALVGHPGFAAVAVICLALGIGVNTTIFSVVDAVLLRPFPFVEPERLVVLNETQPQSGIDEAGLSYLNFRDWQERNTVFSQVAAVSFRSLALTDGEEPERLQGGLVTWNLFPTLGVQPAIGRQIREDDDRAGAPGVALLSDEVWRRRYNAAPSVVGRSILINGNPHTVVGVMPPRFKFPENQQLWVPLVPLDHASPRTARSLFVFARLKPEIGMARARSETTAIAKRLEGEYPVENQGWGGAVRPLRDAFIPDDVRLVVLTMMGAVTLVLLIACANVANLMLARATSRAREISIRAALGAGRGRIVRQLLTESIMLGVLSAPLGVALAYIGLDLLDRAMPQQGQVPYYIDWRVDTRVLMYTLVVSVLTGIVFGLAPALQASRGNLQEALKEGSRGSGAGGRRNRLRNTLVVAEVALSLVLLVGASLFVRSFLNLQNASGGFDPGPLMTMRFYMPGDRYEAAEPKAKRVEDVVRRIEALPGVQAAAASNLIPLGGGGGGASVLVEGRTFPRGEEPRIFYAGVTPHFFRALNVPLLRGRDFTEAEGATRSGVAIINQKMSNRLWPGQDPIGQRFRLASEGNDETGRWMTVIGLTPDIKNDDFDVEEEEDPSAYVPYPYLATRNTGLTIRVAGDPAGITAAVRREIRASDPTLPLFEIQTMDELRELGFWEYELFGWMFSIFGVVALLLAAVGVYGVLSYAVTQRTHEIGIRVALGARRGDVLRLVVAQGAKLAVAGVAIGLLGAFAVTRVITSLLYNVSATDPLSFSGIAVFLTAVAVLASYIPARRAVAVDPIVALREE